MNAPPTIESWWELDVPADFPPALELPCGAVVQILSDDSLLAIPRNSFSVGGDVSEGYERVERMLFAHGHVLCSRWAFVALPRELPALSENILPVSKCAVLRVWDLWDPFNREPCLERAVNPASLLVSHECDVAAEFPSFVQRANFCGMACLAVRWPRLRPRRPAFAAYRIEPPGASDEGSSEDTRTAANRDTMDAECGCGGELGQNEPGAAEGDGTGDLLDWERDVLELRRAALVDHERALRAFSELHSEEPSDVSCRVATALTALPPGVRLNSDPNDPITSWFVRQGVSARCSVSTLDEFLSDDVLPLREPLIHRAAAGFAQTADGKNGCVYRVDGCLYSDAPYWTTEHASRSLVAAPTLAPGIVKTVFFEIMKQSTLAGASRLARTCKRLHACFVPGSGLWRQWVQRYCGDEVARELCGPCPGAFRTYILVLKKRRLMALNGGAAVAERSA